MIVISYFLNRRHLMLMLFVFVYMNYKLSYKRSIFPRTCHKYGLDLNLTKNSYFSIKIKPCK